MKVTRKYIRKLVMEAMNEMDNKSDFDFDYWLGQILLAADDVGTKVFHNVSDGEREDFEMNGMTYPTIGDFQKRFNQITSFPVDRDRKAYYRIVVEYDYNNKTLMYTVKYSDSHNSPRMKILVDKHLVNSAEDAEGLRSAIYGGFLFLERIFGERGK